MRYVTRDDQNKINGSFYREQYPGQERLPDNDPELIAFILVNQRPSEAQAAAISDPDFKPKNVLFYYGYPNSFNSNINGWNNEKVAQDLAAYDLAVLGDGVQNPSHEDYANTQIILPRIKQINPIIKVFGYVACPNTLQDFKDKVDQWNALDATGIFIDESGYDFGTSRSDFNERVEYIHSKSVSNSCFVNAWNPNHVLGVNEDASYPNSTWNPSLLQSSLRTTDWYLMESFPVNTTAFVGNNGYETAAEWISRSNTIISLRKIYKIQVASVGIINDDNTNGQNIFDFAYISSLICSLEGFGTSSNNYGAESSQVKFWERTDLGRARKIYSLEPLIVQENSDPDVYFRFVEKAKIYLDFSSGNQFSSVDKR